MGVSTTRLTDNIYLIDAPYHGRTGVLATYLVVSHRVALIDPGPAPQAEGVLEALRSLGVERLDYVCLTHVHLDHAGGTWLILEEYPDARVHVHPRGLPHMADPSKNLAVWARAHGERAALVGEVREVPQEALLASADGESLELGGVSLEVLWTPGHSTHSHSYYERTSGLLFTGDAAGHTPVGGLLIPTSPIPYNPVDAASSLARLQALEPRTLCISHFGAHEGASELLGELKARVELWARLADRAVEEGLEPRRLLELVAGEDPPIRALLESHPEAETPLLQSLEGFTSYAHWVRRQAS